MMKKLIVILAGMFLFTNTISAQEIESIICLPLYEAVVKRYYEVSDINCTLTADDSMEISVNLKTDYLLPEELEDMALNILASFYGGYLYQIRKTQGSIILIMPVKRAKLSYYKDSQNINKFMYVLTTADVFGCVGKTEFDVESESSDVEEWKKCLGDYVKVYNYNAGGEPEIKTLREIQSERKRKKEEEAKKVAELRRKEKIKKIYAIVIPLFISVFAGSIAFLLYRKKNHK